MNALKPAAAISSEVMPADVLKERPHFLGNGRCAIVNVCGQSKSKAAQSLLEATLQLSAAPGMFCCTARSQQSICVLKALALGFSGKLPDSGGGSITPAVCKFRIKVRCSDIAFETSGGSV